MKKQNETALLKNVMTHRLGWLNEWLRMQKYEIKNRRNTFLCICYNSLLPIMSKEEAQDYIKQLNSKFPYPLSNDKLIHLFDNIGKREEVIKYTNQRIKQLLCISDEEYNLLNPDKNRHEIKERENRVKDKEELKKQVIGFFRDGMEKEEIKKMFAGTMKCASRSTRVSREILPSLTRKKMS